MICLNGVNEIDSLKKSLESVMAMVNQLESARINIDPQNKEVLEEISMQTALLQTSMSLLYKRLYTEDNTR